MNGFFKAVWYISLNPFVSNLPSGSYKYSSLTSSALMLKLGKLCADAPVRNKRKGYQTTYKLKLLSNHCLIVCSKVTDYEAYYEFKEND